MYIFHMYTVSCNNRIKKMREVYMKFNKKTQRIISTAIAVILVLSFVLSYLLSLIR